MNSTDRLEALNIAAEIRRTPAYAFASAFISRNPPGTAPPSHVGGEWTHIDWFANVVRIHLGPDIGDETWAVALSDAGIEVRAGRRGRPEARMSEVNCIDLLQHQDTAAEKARRKRFTLWGETGGTA